MKTMVPDVRELWESVEEETAGYVAEDLRRWKAIHLDARTAPCRQTCS